MSNASNTSASQAYIRVRIVSLEAVMTFPNTQVQDAMYSAFAKRKIFKVPILQIFGSTPMGQVQFVICKFLQKICAHVHHVFPYFFISIPPSVTDCTI